MRESFCLQKELINSDKKRVETMNMIKNVPSAKLIKLLPVDFMKASYMGLHDLDLDLAVDKVFKSL